MALLGPESILVGGWFGEDGQSEPDEGVYTDGWFLYDGITLDELLAKLRANKAIFVNTDGNYEELKV
ncbi:MAG: hypothetical protein DRN81_01110 [Thermoproteota archaeon]|nr:MAG: hypothetical protein DRN81_01110 [Candidatus Korarchaeota archaeon]